MKLLFLLMNLISVSAFAIAKEASSAACAADVTAYCSTVTPGEGRLLQCLKTHRDRGDLSDACKKSGGAIRMTIEEKRDDVLDVCSGDFVRYCNDMRGPQKRRECMIRYKKAGSLSTGCSAVTGATPTPTPAPTPTPDPRGGGR